MEVFAAQGHAGTRLDRALPRFSVTAIACMRIRVIVEVERTYAAYT